MQRSFVDGVNVHPAGNSIFFNVKRIEDPIGLLPAKLILGINKARAALTPACRCSTLHARVVKIPNLRTISSVSLQAAPSKWSGSMVAPG